MTHGSLFSGIGGFELAAEWAGWTNVFHCEWNEFGKKVLKYYWPESESFHDIKTSDFKKYEGRIDIITGGFPCQPFSAAGKRKGADDDRYLWPEMLRVINEVKPRWVVGENVAGLISMVQPADEVTVESGATLFGEEYKETVLRQEYVIETVCKDLERIGYTVQPVVIPACATGAPHRRDRIWFIAHAINGGHWNNGREKGIKNEIQGKHREEICTGLFNRTSYGVTAHSTGSSEGSPGKGERIIGEGSGNIDEPKERGVKAEQHIGRGDVLPGEGATANTVSIGYGGRTEETGNNKSGGIRELVQDCGRNGDEVRCETERCGEVTEDTVSNGRIQREFGEKGTEIWKLRNAGTGSSIGVHLSEGVAPDTNSDGLIRSNCEHEINTGEGGFDALNDIEPNDTTHPNRIRLQGPGESTELGWNGFGKYDAQRNIPDWTNFPTQPPVRPGNDGVPSDLVGITVSKYRIESIKAAGNAIVPQVAYEIFKAINTIEP